MQIQMTLHKRIIEILRAELVESHQQDLWGLFLTKSVVIDDDSVRRRDLN